MDNLLANPLMQSAVVPLVVALAGAVALRLIGRGNPAIGGVAIGLGFLAAYFLILGVPPFPPRGAGQKIFYIVLAAILLGIAADGARPSDKVRKAVALIAAALAVAWLVAPKVSLDAPISLLWLLIFAVWVAIYLRLDGLRGDTLTVPVMLIAAGLTLAAVGFFGSTASGAQLAAALAAAAGGFALVNWPKMRMPVGASAVSAAAVLLALGTQFALYTKVSPVALLLILPIFIADRAAVRMTDRLGISGKPALAPIVLGVVCLVPAALAVVVAARAGGGAPSGY